MVKLHLSMNKKYYLLWMLVVLLPFLAGCSDDEQPEVAEPYLRVVETISCENISSAAATLTLKVESNVEWKVVSEKSWCAVPSENTRTSRPFQLKYYRRISFVMA